MFDWLEINVDRFTQPVVIIGLVTMVLGLILVLTSKVISEAIKNKFNKNYAPLVYIISGILLLVGVMMTILGAK